MKLKVILVIFALVIISSCSSFSDISVNDKKTNSNNTSSKIMEPPAKAKPASNPELSVHFIDVGQGDSIFVVTPSGKSMLIDAGKNDKGFAVVNYIKSLGFNNIDAVIGTHPHEDHIGGMDEVVDNFDIGSIYLPKKTTTTKTFKDLLNSIKNKNLKIKSAAAGVNIDLDPALKIQMFAPNSSDYKDLNNYSAVIKITYESTSFLLEGDAESISEHEMLEKGYNLKADVLKVGHHGSSSSTSEKFLEAVKPNYAVISLGADNEYGHPHRETLKKLSAAKVKVYRTDEQGTIIAQSDGSSIKFNIN